MSGKRLGEETWGAIQRCYEETAEPVTQIAYRFGVSPSLIHHRAGAKGWKKQPPRFGTVDPKPRVLPPQPPRRKRRYPLEEAPQSTDGAAPLSAGQDPLPPQRVPLGPPQTTETRLRRLLAVIDRQLEDLEHHMTSGEIPTPQEEERLVRAAGTTIGNIERVMEMTADLEKDTGGKAGPGKPDAARMRREIAERLERLNAQWQAHGKPR